MEIKDKNIKGYPIVFGSLSEVLQTEINGQLIEFVEMINPMALDNINLDEQDIILNVNHNDTLMLARTTSGTLKVSKDATGLFIDADIAQTKLGDDTLIQLNRGDLNQMSARWKVKEDVWQRDTDGKLKREIKEFKYIKDVSLVARPAYQATLAIEDKRGLETFIDDEKRMIEAKELEAKEEQRNVNPIGLSEYYINKYKY